MKYTIGETHEEEKPVNLTLVKNPDGDVVLKANGVPLLWVEIGGSLLRNRLVREDLAAMGFRTAKTGYIADWDADLT